MSIERCVEELYGDSLDEHCKNEEIERLKAEQGVQDMEEPAVNMEAGSFAVNMGGNEGESGSERPDIPDEQNGVPGAEEDGQ